MTTHPDTQNDLQDLEAQFRTELVLSPEAQDLLFRDARTANTFTDEPVTEEQVRAIYDLVKWAPTSMNNQPLRIVLVRSPRGPRAPVDHMAEGNKAKTVAAPLVAILAADLDFHDEFPETFPHFPGARTCSPPTTRCAPRAPRSTARCRSATSSWASAPRAWPPAR